MASPNYTKKALIDRANSVVLIAAVVGSSLISIGIVAGKLLWDQHSFNEKIMSEKKKARDTLRSNIAKIDQLKQNLETLDRGQTNSKTVLDALPSKHDFPAVASSLDLLAEKSSISRENFQFSGNDTSENIESATSPAPIEIPFQVTVTDSQDKVIDFLVKTELSIRPFQAAKITLKAADGNNMSLDYEGLTYYQPRKSMEIQMKQLTSNPKPKGEKKK